MILNLELVRWRENGDHACSANHDENDDEADVFEESYAGSRSFFGDLLSFLYVTEHNFHLLFKLDLN